MFPSHHPGRSAHRVTPAFAVALVALFVSLGGGAFAATSLIVNSQIQDGTITGRKIHDRSVSLRDLSLEARASLQQTRDATITSRKIHNGSVGIRDLSQAARKALSGAQGVAGTQGTAGPQGVRGPSGPAAHTAFEAEDVSMAPDAAPRVITTQDGATVVMSCASVTATGWAWGVSANVTAATDIGTFTLVNGMANQMLLNGSPDPDAIFPYDITTTFLEFWKTDGTIVRTFGHLEIRQDGCHLSDFRGVVYA